VKTNLLQAFLSHPLVAILALLVTPIGLYHWRQHAQAQQEAALAFPDLGAYTARAEMEQPEERAPTPKLVNAPGIRPVQMHSADVRGVRNSDEVIGVIVDGKPRAYLAAATRQLRCCVVNDVLGDRPITVVHAFEFDEFRVLTSKRRSAAETAPASLEVGILGSIEGTLFLTYGQKRFYFDEHGIPLSDYPFARCTWGAWKNAYPDTDLFTGDLPLDTGT
jgi:hypothetical protein